MKKFIHLTTFAILLGMLATMACGCSEKSSNEEIIDESIATEAATEEETTTTAEATNETVAETSAATSIEETTAEATTVVETTAEATTEATTVVEPVTFDTITDEMALDAIHDRCVLENPDNVELGADHWYVESSDDNQIVVFFLAYTGAEVRYYIDRATGDTYVTEFVEGIHDEEQPSGERFNVKDYICVEIYG